MGKIMKQEKEELTGLYTADTAKMMIEEYLEKEQENVGMISFCLLLSYFSSWHALYMPIL